MENAQRLLIDCFGLLLPEACRLATTATSLSESFDVRASMSAHASLNSQCPMSQENVARWKNSPAITDLGLN